MRKTTAGLLVLFTVVLMAACSSGEERVVTGDDPNGGSRNDEDRDTDPLPGVAGGGEDGLFVSVEVGGGFVPIGFDFRTMPRAVIYDDGTTLSPGAVAAIYPGPAVLPVTEGQVDDEQLRRLVAAATTAGLLDDIEADFGNPPVADAPTTTVTVVVDGEVHVTSVYALGMADESLPGAGLPGADGPQLEARERVSQFVDLVSHTVVSAEGDRYVPDRYRVLALPPDQGDDAVVGPDEREWPFPDVALVEGECTSIGGDRAVEFRSAIEAATEITRWRTDAGQLFTLSIRPVFPHEPACPER
jgi:hypothetical protein